MNVNATEEEWRFGQESPIIVTTEADNNDYDERPIIAAT